MILHNGGIHPEPSIELITQRSKVQILPPQPTHSSAVIKIVHFQKRAQNSSQFLSENLWVTGLTVGTQLILILFTALGAPPFSQWHHIHTLGSRFE